MNITKVPCLAAIVNSPVSNENIGMIVRVVEPFSAREFNGYPVRRGTAPRWVVETCGSLLVRKTKGGLSIFVDKRPYADSCLREIKGDEPEAHDQLLKEKETT